MATPMGKGMRKTTEQFKEEARNVKDGADYLFEGEYKNAYTKMRVRHLLCGNEYDVRPSCFLEGERCPYCSPSHKKTTEEFKQEVRNLVGDEYEVVGEYTLNHNKITIKHTTCGKCFDMMPSFFLQGRRCPYCNRHRKKTHEEFVDLVNALGNNEYEVLGKYVNSSTKTPIRHKKCGKINYTAPDRFIQGNRCPYCYGNKKRTTEEMGEIIKELTNGEYEIAGEYKNSRTKIKIKHLVCGNEFEMTPTNFLIGCRCLYCGEQSRGEQRLIENFDKTGLSYEHLYRVDGVLRSSTTKNKQHKFDFYIPSFGTFIEYDGRQHFDIDEQFWGEGKDKVETTRRYDAEVNEYIKQNNLVCIRIKYKAMKYLDKVAERIAENNIDALRQDPNILVVERGMTKENERRYYSV